MATPDNLNGQQFRQLPMFMTGREILRTTTPGDAEGDHGQMWKAKIQENETSNLDRKLKRDGGVHSPVAISTEPLHPFHSQPTLMNGHHRAISEAIHAPQRLIPVIHAEDYDDPDVFPSMQRARSAANNGALPKLRVKKT